MREIKFRAWDGTTMISTDDVSFDAVNAVAAKNTNIMQYTGLKDRHGVDIYEGDILAKSPEHKMREVVEYEVFGDEVLQGIGFVYDFTHLDWSECEVIGNIWENPELLS